MFTLDPLAFPVKHIHSPSFVRKTYDRLVERGDVSYAALPVFLMLLEGLADTALGLHLMEHGRFGAYWTDVILRYPNLPTGVIEPNPLLIALLTEDPFILALRSSTERITQALRPRLGSSLNLAMIPCGAMRDMLDLPLNVNPLLKLWGVDSDAHTLSLAQALAMERGHTERLNVIQGEMDALPLSSELYDVIVTRDHAMYIHETGNLAAFYTQLFQALKPGGMLVTHTLTPPPFDNATSNWNMTNIDTRTLPLHRIIFMDIVAMQWRPRSINSVTALLERVGFTNITVIEDSLGILPTLCATKSA